MKQLNVNVNQSFLQTVLNIGHTGIPGLWTLDSGRWTLDVGLWTLGSGRWTLDTGLWMLDPGRWMFF